MKKLIGETEEYVVVLEFKTERDRFSVCGVEYGGSDSLFTEDEGEERAKECLEDGELWKMCVENDSTTQGLDEWIEDVLNIDGWMQTLGDVEEINIYNEAGAWVKSLYTMWGSCGQIDMSLNPEDFVTPFIPIADIEMIFKFWSEYHLKDLSEVPEENLEEMRRIFTPETDLSDWRPKVQS